MIKILTITLGIMLTLAGLHCSAFAHPIDPLENHFVVWVNTYDSLDANSNGKPRWYDVLESVVRAYPGWDSTNNVAYFKIAYINTTNDPFSTYIYNAHYDLDTSHVWNDYDPAVNKAAGDDYFLQQGAAWMDADSIHRWYDKYLVGLIGFPLKIRRNPSPVWSTIPSQGTTDSIIAKSTAEFIMTYLRPGVENNGGFPVTSALNKKLGRNDPLDKGYFKSGMNSFKWIPGLYKRGVNSLDSDSLLPQWVICTVLDGLNEQVIGEAINRSASPNIYSNSDVLQSWAVIDQDSDDIATYPEFYPISGSATFRTNLFSTFGTNVLRDTINAGTGGGNPDTINAQLGQVGQHTTSNPVALYFSPGSYSHLPTLGRHSFYTMNMNLANGSFANTSESFTGYTVRDTSNHTYAANQNLNTEFLANGGTYIYVAVHEPGTSTIPHVQWIPELMGMYNTPFAIVATLGGELHYTNFQNVAVGVPIGIWRSTDPLTSITIRGHGLIRDTYLQQGAPTFNAGNNLVANRSEMSVGWSTTSSKQLISLIDIDVNYILPSTAILDTAVLSFTVNSSTGTTTAYVVALQCDSPWVEGTMSATEYQNGASSWDNSGFRNAVDGVDIAVIDSPWTVASIYSHPSDSVNVSVAGSYSLNVTPSIRNRMIGISHGVVLLDRAREATQIVRIYTSEEDTVAYQPSLYLGWHYASASVPNGVVSVNGGSSRGDNRPVQSLPTGRHSWRF